MLKLREISDDDIDLMVVWLDKDYVKKWYDNPASWLSEIKERHGAFSFIKHFIALYDDKSIGFCQYYSCLAAGEEWYGGIELDGVFSIDYLIGEEKFLGKKLGKQIVALLVEKIFSLENSKCIIVQPEEGNKASCNTLLSSGFVFDEQKRLYFKGKNIL